MQLNAPFSFMFSVIKLKGWYMMWAKTPCSPQTPTPVHFPNSSSVVSCPGFFSWDFKTPCSLIFHYGNMLPQRKWGCSAQHHTHQLHLNCDRVQKEDQTWLTVEQWPHELWSDRRWENRRSACGFSHLFVGLFQCRMFRAKKSHDKVGLRIMEKAICSQFGQIVYMSVRSVWSQKTTLT